eukprot:6486797-Amphidinium_carterae.1
MFSACARDCACVPARVPACVQFSQVSAQADPKVLIHRRILPCACSRCNDHDLHNVSSLLPSRVLMQNSTTSTGLVLVSSPAEWEADAAGEDIGD